MVIGFSERRQTVVEGERNGIILPIHVHALRSSEVMHRVGFHINVINATATVMEHNSYNGVDAVFYSEPGEISIVTGHCLYPGAMDFNIPTIIVNDASVENTECFTIKIQNSSFSCYEDDGEGDGEGSGTSNEDNMMQNYFCQHTVCIEDNDGLLNLMLLITYDVTQR